MRMIRGILAIGYCLLFTLGVWWIVQRNQMTSKDFLAAKDLPLNHQLRTGDLESTFANEVKSLVPLGPGTKAFEGRYVHGPVPKGDTLRLDGTDTVPNLTATRGHVELLAMLSRSNADKIDADSCVRLAIKDQTPFKVLATLCPATVHADCTAVIELPLARLGTIDTTPVTVAAEVPCQ
jgi:hypothetical protein